MTGYNGLAAVQNTDPIIDTPPDGLVVPDLRLVLPDPAQVVRAAWEQMDYRPIVVGAIQDEMGRVLVAESAKQAGEFGFLQGGIDEHEADEDEGYVTAFLREIGEEAHIKQEDVVVGGVSEVKWIDRHHDRPPKHGFSDGAVYLVVQALYRGPEDLVLNQEELRSGRWMPKLEAKQMFAAKRSEKRDLLWGAIDDLPQI